VATFRRHGVKPPGVTTHTAGAQVAALAASLSTYCIRQLLPAQLLYTCVRASYAHEQQDKNTVSSHFACSHRSVLSQRYRSSQFPQHGEKCGSRPLGPGRPHASTRKSARASALQATRNVSRLPIVQPRHHNTHLLSASQIKTQMIRILPFSLYPRFRLRQSRAAPIRNILCHFHDEERTLWAVVILFFHACRKGPCQVLQRLEPMRNPC
jgi:hypothetical protein